MAQNLNFGQSLHHLLIAIKDGRRLSESGRADGSGALTAVTRMLQHTGLVTSYFYSVTSTGQNGLLVLLQSTLLLLE